MAPTLPIFHYSKHGFGLIREPPPPTGRGLRSGFRISKNDKFLSPQMPDLNAKCAMTATTRTILAFTWFCQLSMCLWSKEGLEEEKISMSKIDF